MSSKDQTLLLFAQWIEKEVGIIYETHNLYQLQDRLETLMKTLELFSVEDLWQVIESGKNLKARQQLVDISTNNETSFFRDPRFFEVLEKNVLPNLDSKFGEPGPLKIWSVASSSGQEPYTLAMILQNFKVWPKIPHILATDISERILARAQAGIYSEIEVHRGLTDLQRKKYFQKDIKGQWHLDAEIRKMVDFKVLNLKTQFNLGTSFDLILCRNVLIYQKVESKKQIIEQIKNHLNPGGYFMLGSGESLIGLSDAFDQKLVDGVAVYTRKLQGSSPLVSSLPK